MKLSITYLFRFYRVFFYLFLLAIGLNTWVIQSTKSRIYDQVADIPHNEYGLVLGTSKEIKGETNPYFVNRLDAAILLYQTKKIDKIIVSGDKHAPNYDETNDMTTYLIEHGIPENKIFKDAHGFRTWDSVKNFKNSFKCQNLTIISQVFHNQRALFIANYLKINAVAFAAGDTPSARNYTRFREFFAKCWLFKDILFN